MRLASRSREKSLRRQVRREMRRDRSLWKDYKRHKPRWLRRLGPERVYLLLAVLWLSLLMFRWETPVFPLLAAALYATGTALWRGENFHSGIFHGYDRAVLIHLPLAEDDFLRHQWRALGRSWTWAFLLFLWVYGFAAYKAGLLAESWTFLPLAAALQTVSALGFSLLLLVWAPGFPRAKVAIPFYLLIFVSIYLPSDLLVFLWSAVMVVPGGWVSHAVAAWMTQESAAGWWAAPAIAICLALPLAVATLHRRYLPQLEAQELDAFTLAIYGVEDDEPAPDYSSAHGFLPHSQPHFLQPADWSQTGWLEGLVEKRFDQRQKAVADFMLAYQLGSWSRNWRTAAVLSAVGMVVTATLTALPSWTLFLPMVAAAMWAAPLLGGNWPGFHCAPASGQLIPAYAGYPLSYAEISRVLLKANVVRILAWAPLVIAYCAVLAWRLLQAPALGADIGFRVVLLLLALQPAVIAAYFSSGSNDTRRRWWQVLPFVILALGLLAVALVGAVMLFTFHSFLLHGLALFIVVVATGLAWVGYGLLINRGRLDLLVTHG